MSTKRKFITMFCAPLLAVSAFPADWPQYYGPSRNSTSTEKGLLRTWPNDGPKVLWTAPLGIGFGGPAVSAGKVYLLDRDDNVGDTLRVYDLSNGKELWTFAYAGPGKVEFPGSRSTPTVDGDRVYTVGMLEICTASAPRPRSLSGIRTSGRISAAAAPSPSVHSRPPQRAANCRYGASCRTR